jgi:phage gp45-like
VTGIKELAAKVRNLFCEADFIKRGGDGVIQIRTRNGKVLEKAEAFPYGFFAKAKSGKALVFCQGGNFDGFEILPMLNADSAALPELVEGDAALYTGKGGCVIVREAGDVEVTAKGAISAKTEKGTVLIKNPLSKLRGI